MSNVNELEIVTQDRILHKIFEEKLKYTYLGNFEDRENNSNIEEELLLKFLIKITINTAWKNEYLNEVALLRASFSFFW